MGSLASRPQIPRTVQQPVYIPVSSPVSSNPSVTPVPAGGGNDPVAPPANLADVAAQARELGLLSRSRGSLSTILTGFRGILGNSGATSPRKTLLGE